MASRYTLKEPKLRGYQPPRPFSLYDNGHHIHEILRLLIGSVDAYDKHQAKLIKLNEDYSKMISPNRSARPEKLVSLIYQPEEAITLDDYQKFLSATWRLNKDFFATLEFELVHSLVCAKSGSQTEAFLHFYRMLEHMALAFPVLYSKYQTDFRRSHAFHKSLFKSERDSDFVALRVFVEELARASNLTGLPFVVDYSIFENTFARACTTELKARLQDFHSVIDENTHQVSLTFEEFPSFVIAVRNKTFHFMNEAENFRICEMGGGDILFRPIVEQSLSWFLQLFAEMVRAISRDHILLSR